MAAESKKPVINSLADVNKLHQQEMVGRIKSRREMVTQASRLVNNLGGSELIRTEFLRFLLDGPRDIDAECGYPAWLTPDHYRVMYDREGVAKRVVECEPKESWKKDPELYEDEDPGQDTPFETAWKAFNKKFNMWHFLRRIDILSGVGQFGILLLGLDDGLDLRDPIEGVNDDGTYDDGLDMKLLYLRAFSEEVVFVKTRETDVTSPRYGLPTRYTIQFRDFPNWGIQAGEIIARDVHWSRCIHVADNRKMSELYGVPRMQPVYNRLYDLRKVYASSGEGFWKGAFPGISFEVNPDIADQGIEIDKEGIRKEFADYQNGLQRYLAVTGVTAKSLQPQVTDPTPTTKNLLQAISVALDIPWRVLFGSEEAKLAADSDTTKWNETMKDRQTKYITPMIIRPTIDRFIGLGILPKPKDYEVDWPDLQTPTDQDKAGVALQKTQAMQAYVQGGVSQLVPPDLFLTLILGMTTEEKDAIMDGADDFNQDQDDQEEEGLSGEGTLGGPAVPDQGNVLTQDNLGRSTTTAPGAKQADPDLVHMPSLNQSLNQRRKPKSCKMIGNL